MSNNIALPVKENDLLTKLLEVVNKNQEVKTLWEVSNVVAIDRMSMTDHGYTHFQIVANIALRLIRILHEEKVQMSVEKDFKLDYKYAELIVVLGSLFHDLGMTINRQNHEEYSLILANNLMREILTFLPIRERTIVISETLHAIINHRKDGIPLTIEGGILTVADALDMSQGRSRIPFQAGKVDIHSVSALAIDNIEIKKGKKVPILILVHMNNSAGLFQVDQLLKKKIKSSGIADHFRVEATVANKKEKAIIKEFSF